MITQENLNAVLKSLFVAKINLNEDLPEELVKLGLVPNTNDCFLISEETCKRMEVLFRKPKTTELSHMKPKAGSKCIGSFRDKGSITKVMKRFVPLVKYQCNNSKEVERLSKALKEMRGEDTYFEKLDNNILLFQIDVIANPSTGRDNVSALVLQSCLELEGILEDKPQEYTLEEIVNMDVKEVIQRRPHQHEVIIYDNKYNKIVYSFGLIPILLEDFFWQPKHDNSLYCKQKDFSCTYSQFKDGIELLMPSLYKALTNSIDYSSIHEYCVLLGMEFLENNYSNEVIEQEVAERENAEFATEEDML